MDHKKSVSIKKEESTVPGSMVEVYPSSMKVKEELQEETNEEFLEDPLLLENRHIDIKEDMEWKMTVNTSVKNNYLEHPLVISPPTIYIEDDPEVNLETEELESIIDGHMDFSITECDPLRIKNEKYFEDPLLTSQSTDYINEDPEVNLEVEELESVIDGHTEFSIPECDPLGIKNEEEIASKSCTPDHTRLPTITTSEAVGSSFEETCLREMPGEKLEIACTRNDHSLKEFEFQYFFCSSCKERFLSKYRLIKHVFSHIDGVQSPVHICKWCGVVFVSRGSLKKHLSKSKRQQYLSVMKEGCRIFPDKCTCDEVCKIRTISKHYPLASGTEHIERHSLNLETCNGSHGNATNIDYFSLTESYRSKSLHLSEKSPQYLTDINGPVSSQSNVSHAHHKSHKCISSVQSIMQQRICHEHCVTFPNECSSHQSSDLLNGGKVQNNHDVPQKLSTTLCNFKELAEIHTGEDSRTAVNPGKSFIHTDHIKIHNTLPGGEKLGPIHTRYGHYKCDMCGMSFMRLNDIKLHVLKHTGERPHKCVDCGKTFTQVGNLKRHTLLHSGQSLHKCDVCGESFYRKGELEAHSQLHNGEISFKCDDCGIVFNRKNEHRAHAKMHTREKVNKCDVCGKSFAQLCYLKKHALVHSGERPHKCDECGKSFTQLSNLNSHKYVHTGERPHKCHICGKSFLYLNKLKIHSLLHTGETYECDICGKCFTQLGRLKTHLLIHTVQSPQKCNICGKSFAVLSKLNNHTCIHTGEKLHKCYVCGKSFTQLWYLKRHSVIHSGEKPYRCDVCGRSFTWLVSFKAHSCKLTGESPYKCTVCGKYFTMSSNLKVHNRLHTGERPYKCDVCLKTFTRLAHLKSHALVHT